MTHAQQGSTTQLQSWLLRHQQGDETAKAAIMAHASERLRILVSKMLRRDFSRLRRWEQTDDVLQNALIRLHSSLRDLQPENVAQFMGLAATQIRRTLIDLARHHFGPEGKANLHLTDGHQADTPRIVDVQPDRPEPDSISDWTAFHEAVESLPSEEQEVFHLIYYDGLAQSDAAELLKVNERTIRRKWQSARILLHQKLNEETSE